MKRLKIIAIITFLLGITLLIVSCDTAGLKTTYNIPDFGYVDEGITIYSATKNVEFELADNDINGRIYNNNILTDVAGSITVIVKYKGKIIEEKVIHLIYPDEDIIEKVELGSISEFQLGRVYSFGIEEMDESIYTITLENEEIFKLLDNNNLAVIGIGSSNFSIYNNLTNTFLFQERLDVYEDNLTHQIKQELIDMKIINSLGSTVTSDELDLITNLDISKSVYNDNLNLEGLKLLKNLEYLDISNNELEDISFVKNFTNLIELKASHNKIKNLTIFNDTLELVKLDVSNNEINSISNLTNNKKIKSLNIANNKIADLSPISTLEDLEELYIGGNSFNNIEYLSSLNSLKKLDVSYSNVSAFDVFGLSYVGNLDYIDLSGIEFSLTTIPNSLENLKALKINDINLNFLELPELLKFNMLETLEFGNNRLISSYIESFIISARNNNSFPNLKRLGIGGNGLASLPDLTMFENLESLDLSNSYRLAEISELEKLRGLKSLNLSNNNLINNDGELVEIFNSLKNLEILNVVDGFKYFDSQLFNYFKNRTRSSRSFKIEVFENEWMMKGNTDFYEKIIYFSLEQLNEHLKNESGKREYEYQGGKGKIIINLVNENKYQTLNIQIPKDVVEVNIYSSQLMTHTLSFRILERGNKEITFNLYDFKTSASNIDLIHVEGESKLIIVYSGENELASSLSGSGIVGYDIKISPKDFSLNNKLKITGGKGKTGTDGPSNNGERSERKGGNGGSGGDGIRGTFVFVDGKVDIAGGRGGNGGAGGDRKSWGIGLGSSGNGGDGGNGGNGGYGIRASNIEVGPQVLLKGGGAGTGGEAGNGGGLGYNKGSPGDPGTKGHPRS